MRQGPFPPPELPSFTGITGPSVICPSRLRPSRASRCRRNAVRHAPRQTSLVAHKSSRARAVITYPGRSIGCVSRSLPQSRRPSSLLWRVGFCIDIFGACTMFTSVTARTLRFPPYRGIFLKCFRPFVASWPAPSASGRSESGRTGISPVGLVCLRQGTHNNRCENALRPFVFGRKGLMFSDTVNGAVASANLFSIVKTAKANGVEPHAYLYCCSRSFPMPTQLRISKRCCRGM